MPTRNRFAWSSQSHEEQLQMAYKASREDLRMMARAFDWSTDNDALLTWIMSNKSVDLASALTVFFNGDPARFNYIHKRDVPEQYCGETSLLDNICLRINSGFYRVSKVARIENRERLDKWLFFQSADRKEGRRGRWILDEAIVQKAVAPHNPTSESPAVKGLRARDVDPSAKQTVDVKTAIGRRLGGLISEIVHNRRTG